MTLKISSEAGCNESPVSSRRQRFRRVSQSQFQQLKNENPLKAVKFAET
jgi:hypothetical protein